MDFCIELLKEQDAAELFQFESDNRAFFEKMVPGRGDDYFIYENFLARHTELIEEQNEGTSYFYLIRNSSGTIVGRINLVDIDRDQHLGNLGYRVGEKFTGKGVANTAVKLLLQQVGKYGIQEIHAKTTTNNIASQKVLEKNGFVRASLSKNEVEFNAKKIRFVHHIWTN